VRDRESQWVRDGRDAPPSPIVRAVTQISQNGINTGLLSFVSREGLWNWGDEFNWTSLPRHSFLSDSISQRHEIE
jgi:hypothetical protein